METFDRILRAKIQLQKKRPFFGWILLNMEHTEDKKIPTMCINIKGKIRYNPDWVNTLTESQLEGVVEHEALHLVLEHLKRRILYLTKSKVLSTKVWQLCEDVVVNDILVSNDQDLPEGIIPEKDHTYTVMPFGIELADIDKKSVEYIYEELMKQMPKQPSQDQKQGSKSKQGGGGSGQEPDQDDEESDDEEESDSDSSGGGQSKDDKDGDDDDDSDQGDESDEEQDEGTDIANQLPKGWDEHERADEEEVTEEQQEDELKKWRKVFCEAVEYARSQGNVPLGVERLVDGLFKEKMNWRGLLYRFVSKQIPFDYSFERPAKKSYSLGVYLPSTTEEKVEVVVSLDTSGSITDKQLKEFVSEMIGIARCFNAVDMIVIVCDAEIHDEPLDLKNATPDSILEYLDLKGRGGTSHVPVFRWIAENRPRARLLIAFTDGATTFPDEDDVTIQTLWVLGGDHILEEEVPFGKAVIIPKYED